MDPAADEAPGEDRPSRGLAILMILAGVVFLMPFLFIAAAGDPPFSPGALGSALLSVGWTLGLGLVFLIFGSKRLRAAPPEDDASE